MSKFTLSSILILILGLVGCSNGQDNYPEYSLYIENSFNEKEKVADFYQSLQGYNDCKTVALNWTNHKTFCHKN